jgi:hypothetical protein
MKTLTVDCKEYTAKYKGRLIFDCRLDGRLVDWQEIESLAFGLGYTHIRWLQLHIGCSNIKFKIN